MSGLLAPVHCQAILEELPSGIYIVDREWKILFWNKGAEQITGYQGAEVIGRHCHADVLMHCGENQTSMCGERCPLKDTMLDGRPRDANVYLRHKEGHRVPVRVRAVPMRDSEGMIIGAAEIFDERHEGPHVAMHPHAQAVQNQTDSRTGVSDEASTRSYLEACLQDYEEDHIPFGVLLVAIDGIEEFRQAHGPQAVTKIMHAAATTLIKSPRESDIVGDWTEDRFLALLINCPASTLSEIALTLKRVAGTAEIQWWGDRLTFTVSIGAAAVRPGDTAASLLTRADLSLASCASMSKQAGEQNR